jgi:D-alanyl-D-alanine carboxypeptidase
MTVSSAHRSRVEALLEELRIPRKLVVSRGLRICDEARELVVVEVDEGGREHMLIPAAADAWRVLRDSALADGVTLQIASAFRSLDRQVEIVRGKLDRGLSIESVLAVSAPPGYSEHHTGRAVDVITLDSPPLQAGFEQTDAFRWLTENAARFHYEMSFPRGNPYGYDYEPWHWCFRRDEG